MVSGNGSGQSVGGTQQGNVRTFLKRKDIEISFQRYAIDAMSAMAQGLFASLLIGTIFNTIGNLAGVETFNNLGSFATSVSGPAMAVAIGFALKAPPLVLYSLAAVGYAANAEGGAGGPLAVLVVAIVASELGKAVSKETKVDILVTPAVVVGLGCLLALVAAPGIGAVASAVGGFVMWATELQPFLMGTVVAVAVGMALTLPISSAAICAALGLTGLAGGAALAGCCAQMVGFAAISFRDNGWGGVVSQGIGTSMLQMGNIMRKPLIWVPTIVASAVCGPVATVVFGMQQNGPAIASGMGTCGLVGPIGLYSGWVEGGIAPGAFEWLGMALVCFVLPVLVSWVVAFVMRRAGLICDGDLKLDA
ncbi:MAG: PTS sugar transporter subunit IIC [Eggerthellaceae bacterium]|nr:PTS sugar transporter subunit IIC [Eggerthellaceae bacterium]